MSPVGSNSDQHSDSSEIPLEVHAANMMLARFLDARTWQHSRHILVGISTVLGDLVLPARLLERLAQMQEDSRVREAFLERHRLLLRCLTLGIDDAFRDLEPSPALWDQYRRAEQADTRFKQYHDPLDLNEVVDAWESICQHPDFAVVAPRFRLPVLAACATAHRSRHAFSGEIEDLHRAVELWEEVIGATANDPQAQVDYLFNLTLALGDRYTRTHTPDDLERAIQITEGVVRRVPSHSPKRLHALNSLGMLLLKRHTRTLGKDTLLERVAWMQEAPEVSLTDLERAIQVIEVVARETPADWRDRPGYLNNLGVGLRDRYLLKRDPDDLKRGTEILWQAARDSLAQGTETWLSSIRNLGAWASERGAWAEAAEIYGYGLQEAERSLHARLSRSSRQAWLRETRGMAAWAAYALARNDNLEASVVTMERGRAVLLTAALEGKHHDLERLKELGRSDLYARYQVATDRWNSLLWMEQNPDQASLSRDALLQAMMATRSELDAIIAEIQQVDGYDFFPDPVTFSDIQAAAGTTPLVYIVAADLGGLALIVRPRSAPIITPIWLPGLSENALNEVLLGPDDDVTLAGYSILYREWRDNPSDRAARSAWFASLDNTTQWLWSALMGPLLEAMVSDSAATLVPYGTLALLPLHAAWTHDSAAPTSRRYALDIITLSYAPNSRSLAIARAIAARTPSDGLLAVDEPQPVSAEPLPNSSCEVQTAASSFARSHILRHTDATRKAVLTLMPKYPVMHFSCHGYADVLEPMASGVVLANNELLTLRDLFELHLPGVRLVILSACETNIPDMRYLDEVVSLPTGLLQAGVAGIVASSWSVLEISTAMLMIRFYDLWCIRGVEPPEALCQAQKWVRDTTNGEKAAHFRSLLPELSSESLSNEIAARLYQAVILLRPNERRFEHPFHWSAFSYVGV